MYQPLLVTNANLGKQVLPSILHKNDNLTLNMMGKIQSDSKQQVWSTYTRNTFEFLYPNLRVLNNMDHDEKQVIFNTECTNDKSIWIQYETFEPTAFKPSDTDNLLNQLVFLYQGLSNASVPTSTLEMIGEMPKQIEAIDTSYYHNSQAFDWKQVIVNNTTFDLELSTKRLINLLSHLLGTMKTKQAIAIMNFLCLDYRKQEEKSIA